LFSELKRRNVFRVAVAYLAAAWLLTEVAGTLFPAFGIPDWGVRFVVAVLALGFLPTLVFSWVYELTPDGLKLEKEVVRETSFSRQAARRLDGITIGLVVLALAFITVDRLWLSSNLAGPDAALKETVAQPAEVDDDLRNESAPSIAVLPFVNMSSELEQEYFSDGISEELLNLLSNIPGLRVAARTSSFSFKGKDVEIPEIARRLRVTHVLEGSVRKADSQVRITAQLIKADDGYHLWSESFDRQLDDIFAIQDEIARAVVDALKLTLLGDAPRADAIDPEAYVLYLQAENVGNHLTEEALEQSNAMLERVLAIAPDYARAWRLLARNYAVQAQKGTLPREEGFALAREAIDRALATDPELAEAHSWLGAFEASTGGDLELAAKGLRHALRLKPRDITVISHAATFLSMLDRDDEAIAVQEYLLTRDPLNPALHSNLAWNYLAVGRLDDARAALRTLLILSPDFEGIHSALCWTFLLKGDYDAALKAIHEETNEAARLYGLVTVYHTTGRTVEADLAVNELIDKYGQDLPYWVASLLAYRGEIDRSFEWLEKAVVFKSPPDWIATRMWFANLYDDPRWLPFLERIGRSPAQLEAIGFEVTLPRE